MRCLVAVAMMLFGSATGCVQSFDTDHCQVVDLTYAFDEQTIYWPTAEGFVLERGHAGYTQAGYYYEAHALRLAEHGGTHIDAPVHFYRGRWTVDQIPPQRLIGRGVVVDVSQACERDRDYRVGVGDFQAWESRHGRIPQGAVVLIRTGFGRFWPDRQQYLGTAERGLLAVAKLRFPGLHPDAARWLIAHRRIRMVGIDTASIDHGQSVDFATHVALFEQNVPALENVANLEGLPIRGFTVIALPMKVRGGSGGPTRIVALLPR